VQTNRGRTWFVLNPVSLHAGGLSAPGRSFLNDETRLCGFEPGVFRRAVVGLQVRVPTAICVDFAA
jgi:hypothetical protein